MLLELGWISEVIFDYVPTPPATMRELVQRDPRARVWECRGCGFWCPAGT